MTLEDCYKAFCIFCKGFKCVLNSCVVLLKELNAPGRVWDAYSVSSLSDHSLAFGHGQT